MLVFLSVLAAASALFLSFLVFTVRQDANVTANRWLAAFLLSLGIFMIEDGLYEFGVMAKNLWLLGVLDQSIFLAAPLLYMAVSEFVAVQRVWKWYQLLHFVPALIFLLLSMPLFFSDATEKAKYLITEQTPMQLTDWIIVLALIGQFFVYEILCFRKLIKHQRNLQNITADAQRGNLDWLLYFLVGIMIMTATWAISVISFRSYSDPRWQEPIYFIGVYALGYFTMRQKEVFPFSYNDRKEVAELLEEQENTTEQQLYYFSSERLQLTKNDLLEKMETKKPYLDPELSLPTLAHQMNLSLHEMSELVNQGFQENFAQFVNRYRVEESKRLLLSRQHGHLSIVGIAFEAGFNSKTTFNTVFKKNTGISPTEYQKQGKNNLL